MRSAWEKGECRWGGAWREELQRLAERTGLLAGWSLFAVLLLRGGDILLMAFKRQGKRGLMPGFRVRIGGCPGLNLLRRMPIRHRCVEQQKQCGEEAESFSLAGQTV